MLKRGFNRIMLFLVIMIGILTIFSGCVDNETTTQEGQIGETPKTTELTATLQPDVNYIQSKIVPVYISNQTIGEVYGGVAVEVIGPHPIHSDFAIIVFEGWIWQEDIFKDTIRGDNIKLQKPEYNLWAMSPMVKDEAQPNYRVAMLKEGAPLVVLEPYENFAKIRTVGLVEKKSLISQREVKKF